MDYDKKNWADEKVGDVKVEEASDDDRELVVELPEVQLAIPGVTGESLAII